MLFSSIKNQKNASIFVFSKTHNLHAIHALFLRIVSARNLLLSSERDTASGIYAHKEVARVVNLFLSFTRVARKRLKRIFF